MKTARDWEVPVYYAAVLIAFALLFAITAVPGNSAELFPNASADDLVQGIRWLWDGASGTCEQPRTGAV